MSERVLTKQNIMRAIMESLAEKASPSKKELTARFVSEQNPENEAFAQLLDWATFSLRVSGLIDRNVGETHITEQGSSFLQKHEGDITLATLRQFPEFTSYFLKL